MIRDISAVFNEFSDGYTEKMIRYVPHYLRMLSSLVKYIPEDFRPQYVLELGCGNGNATELIQYRFPTIPMHLIDASPEMIQQSRVRFDDAHFLEFEINYFQNIKLEASKYDLAIAALSIHHLEGDEKRELFGKVFHSLNDQGIFACCDLFVDKTDDPYHTEVLAHWEQFVRDNQTSVEEWQWLMNHYEKFDRPDKFENQREWLCDVGFKNVQMSWNDGPWGCWHAWK